MRFVHITRTNSVGSASRLPRIVRRPWTLNKDELLRFAVVSVFLDGKTFNSEAGSAGARSDRAAAFHSAVYARLVRGIPPRQSRPCSQNEGEARKKIRRLRRKWAGATKQGGEKGKNKHHGTSGQKPPAHKEEARSRAAKRQRRGEPTPASRSEPGTRRRARGGGRRDGEHRARRADRPEGGSAQKSGRLRPLARIPQRVWGSRPRSGQTPTAAGCGA